MIIYVKINKTHAEGSDPISAAYKAWTLGSLLDDSNKRNKYSFLIAIYKKEIVGTYSIQAIAEEGQSKPRRVVFALANTTDECDKEIRRKCQGKILSGINKARKECGYIDVSISLKCKYNDGQIPVLGPNEIRHGQVRLAGQMELEFIWVDDYRSLKSLGVNFNHSGRHHFRYENNNLILLPNEVNKIDFGPRITSVTAIAGENGSGKSSICEISLLTTATRINGAFGYDVKFKGIVVYGHYIFFHNNLTINNIQSLQEEGYIIKSFQESPFEDISFEEREQFMNGGFIYYSNALDLRSDFTAMNLANVSSQNLLREDYITSTSYQSVNPHRGEIFDDFRGMDMTDTIQIYNKGQGYRATKFYLDYSSFIPFRQPDILILKSTYTGNNRWLRLGFIDDFELKRGYEEIENSIFNDIYPHRFVTHLVSGQKKKLDSKILKLKIKELYRFNLLVAKGRETKTPFDLLTVRDFVLRKEIKAIDISLIDDLINIHEKLVEISKTYEGEYEPFSVANYYNNLSDWRYVFLEQVFIPNSEEARNLLRKFIQLEEQILQGDRTYRRVSNYALYPQLSSGESSFINLFSRIHDIALRYKLGYDERNSVILFLDEPEVGLHPDWSKKLFNWIHTFLTNHSSGLKFQIILTTHSPYLLSDLPAQNVQLLKKDVDGRTVIVDSVEYKTFGANINELLATSFFLEDGLIGEFAQTQIQNLIDNLQDDPPPDLLRKMSYDQMAEMIGIIAEPFLQEKLTEMYYRKVPDAFKNEEERRLRIIELERELDKLRNG